MPTPAPRAWALPAVRKETGFRHCLAAIRSGQADPDGRGLTHADVRGRTEKPVTAPGRRDRRVPPWRIRRPGAVPARYARALLPRRLDLRSAQITESDGGDPE